MSNDDLYALKTVVLNIMTYYELLDECKQKHDKNNIKHVHDKLMFTFQEMKNITNKIAANNGGGVDGRPD